MPRGDPLHGFHGKLVLVNGDVAGAENRRHFMLPRRDLVVLGGGGDAHFPQLHIQIRHKRADALTDDTEVLILQLLSLGRGCAEQGTAGVNQISAFEVFIAIDNEIFLLRADGRCDLFHIVLAEQAQQTHALRTERFHRAQQRRFVVERLAGVGDKHGGNTQNRTGGEFFDKRRGGHIPRGIAARVVRGAKPAGGEAGGVRFPHDQLLAGEVEDGFALFGVGNKGVMLFRRDAVEGLEPVGIMGRAQLQRPVHHGIRDRVGILHGQLAAVFHHLNHLAIDTLRQSLAHDGLTKYIRTE